MQGLELMTISVILRIVDPFPTPKIGWQIRLFFICVSRFYFNFLFRDLDGGKILKVLYGFSYVVN